MKPLSEYKKKIKHCAYAVFHPVEKKCNYCDVVKPRLRAELETNTKGAL